MKEGQNKERRREREKKPAFGPEEKSISRLEESVIFVRGKSGVVAGHRSGSITSGRWTLGCDFFPSPSSCRRLPPTVVLLECPCEVLPWISPRTSRFMTATWRSCGTPISSRPSTRCSSRRRTMTWSGAGCCRPRPASSCTTASWRRPPWATWPSAAPPSRPSTLTAWARTPTPPPTRTRCRRVWTIWRTSATPASPWRARRGRAATPSPPTSPSSSRTSPWASRPRQSPRARCHPGLPGPPARPAPPAPRRRCTRSTRQSHTPAAAPTRRAYSSIRLSSCRGAVPSSSRAGCPSYQSSTSKLNRAFLSHLHLHRQQAATVRATTTTHPPRPIGSRHKSVADCSCPHLPARLRDSQSKHLSSAVNRKVPRECWCSQRKRNALS